MKFHDTAIAGAHVVELEPFIDDRGYFARAYSVEEFAAHGIDLSVVHANTTFTRQKGTIRGLHYQVPPATEAKLIRCIRGAIYQVAVDLRPDSPTYLAHVGVEINTTNRLALYIPGLCAAGAQAMTDDAESFYLVGAAHSPAHERGVRFDDPAFGIRWPVPVTALSSKDSAWAPFVPDRKDPR